MQLNVIENLSEKYKDRMYHRMSANQPTAISVLCFTKMVYAVFKTVLKANSNRHAFIYSFI